MPASVVCVRIPPATDMRHKMYDIVIDPERLNHFPKTVPENVREAVLGAPPVTEPYSSMQSRPKSDGFE